MPKPQTKLRLHDLRPNTTVDCPYCGQTKPHANAVRFHAFWVCADCTKKLNALEEKK